MINIFQNKNVDLIGTKKTVNWLVNNTIVSVFNPINFTGYQRQIDNNHCKKIVEYLKAEFFMPTAIICATDNDYNDETPLRIVDGQHRINAFKIMREEEPDRYKQICDYEIPVIVMAKVDENTEIDTFITINKTSKKVDTSLALVLKNKMNKYRSTDDLTIPKAEYLAVELAQKLNFDEDSNNIWFDKILFEGNPKNTSQLISLNAFVKSTRTLVNHLAKNRIISLNWIDEGDIICNTEKCKKIIFAIWLILQQKWQELFYSDLDKRRIIQGAIGFTAINKVVIHLLNQKEYKDEYDLIEDFENFIKRSTISANKWLPGEMFSKYSSESGYTIVAQELISNSYD